MLRSPVFFSGLVAVFWIDILNGGIHEANYWIINSGELIERNLAHCSLKASVVDDRA